MAESTRFVVAVVDDDSRTLESLADLLEAAGYEVRLYSSGITAWNHCPWAAVDCLMSDIGMPDMSGFELRRLVLSRRPDLPVILITARHEIADQQRARAQGSRFFRKPFDGQALLAAIGQALQSTDGGEGHAKRSTRIAPATSAGVAEEPSKGCRRCAQHTDRRVDDGVNFRSIDSEIVDAVDKGRKAIHAANLRIGAREGHRPNRIGGARRQGERGYGAHAGGLCDTGVLDVILV